MGGMRGGGGHVGRACRSCRVGRPGQAPRVLVRTDTRRTPAGLALRRERTHAAELDAKVVSDTVAVEEDFSNRPPPYCSRPVRRRHAPFAVRARREGAPPRRGGVRGAAPRMSPAAPVARVVAAAP